MGVCALQGGALLPPTEAVPVPEAYFPLSNYTSSSWPVPEWCARSCLMGCIVRQLTSVHKPSEQRQLHQDLHMLKAFCHCLIYVLPVGGPSNLPAFFLQVFFALLTTKKQGHFK